jgi:16S rRNA (uracil1498-N3)-methyltransferase
VYRFYVSREQIGEDTICICNSDVNHIKNVLRLEPGDWLVVCDGQGKDYVCRIQGIWQDHVELSVEKIQESGTELDTRITLFQGVPKKDKMEFIIQKAVELGVYEIVPVMMKRCVVKLEREEKIQKKVQRWQAIAESAAKQCDRGIVPVVHPPVSMEQAFDMASSLEYNMIPYELQDGIDAAREIVEEACTKSSVGIFIGPEGGLEKQEVEQAVSMGARPLTLGRRILRTETAGMALLSIMMFQLQQETGHR